MKSDGKTQNYLTLLGFLGWTPLSIQLLMHMIYQHCKSNQDSTKKETLQEEKNLQSAAEKTFSVSQMKNLNFVMGDDSDGSETI